MRWLRIHSVVFLFSLVLNSCIQHNEEQEVGPLDVKQESLLTFYPKYAKGFVVLNDTLVLRNPKDTMEVMQRMPLRKHRSFVLQSTTHVPFLEVINAELITGCNFTGRIKSTKTKERIEKGEVQEMLSGSHFDYEKLLAMNPDAILVYPFDAKEIKVLDEMNLNYILCFEYLEEGLLARAEWIKFFGLVSGELEASKKFFSGIENRFLEIPKGDFTGTILLNLPFNDQWNVPSGISPTVELIERAGFEYPWKNIASEGNIIIPKEEIIELGLEAETWIIFAGRGDGFATNDLIKEDPLFRKFKSMKGQNVIFCNTNTTPYFEEALIEPDVLLSNLIHTAQTKEKTKYFEVLK